MAQVEPRLTEAVKMGFKRVILPASSAKRMEAAKIEVMGVESVAQALELI